MTCVLVLHEIGGNAAGATLEGITLARVFWSEFCYTGP